MHYGKNQAKVAKFYSNFTHNTHETIITRNESQMIVGSDVVKFMKLDAFSYLLDDQDDCLD